MTTSYLIILRAGFAGIVVGVLSGFVMGAILNLAAGRRALIVDGLLGAVSLPLVLESLMRVPWRQTSTSHVGGSVITTTTLHYPHPIMAACGAAIVLPVVYELLHFYIGRSARKTSGTR